MAPKEKNKKNQTGVEAAAEMLAGLDEDHRKRLLNNVAKEDSRLAKMLEERLFSFNHILKFDLPDFQLWYSKAPRMKVALALRGCSEDAKKFFRQRLSKRAFETLFEEVDAMGPQKKSDVDAARKEIVEVAASLGLLGQSEKV